MLFDPRVKALEPTEPNKPAKPMTTISLAGKLPKRPEVTGEAPPPPKQPKSTTSMTQPYLSKKEREEALQPMERIVPKPPVIPERDPEAFTRKERAEAGRSLDQYKFDPTTQQTPELQNDYEEEHKPPLQPTPKTVNPPAKLQYPLNAPVPRTVPEGTGGSKMASKVDGGYHPGRHDPNRTSYQDSLIDQLNSSKSDLQLRQPDESFDQRLPDGTLRSYSVDVGAYPGDPYQVMADRTKWANDNNVPNGDIELPIEGQQQPIQSQFIDFPPGETRPLDLPVQQWNGGIIPSVLKKTYLLASKLKELDTGHPYAYQEGDSVEVRTQRAQKIKAIKREIDSNFSVLHDMLIDANCDDEILMALCEQKNPAAIYRALGPQEAPKNLKPPTVPAWYLEQQAEQDEGNGPNNNDEYLNNDWIEEDNNPNAH